MDVQNFFKSLNFFLKVIKLSGLTSDNKYYRYFWIFTHFTQFNGFFVGAIWSLNFEVEMWKIIEKFVLVSSCISLNIKFLKIINEMKNVEIMKNQVENICIQLNLTEMELTRSEESNFRKKVFQILFTITVIPILSTTFVIPFFDKLTFEISYPFELDSKFWFRVATIHQLYCNLFMGIIFISNIFFSIIFISYSIDLLGKIHKELYHTTGLGREEVFIRCITSFIMIKKLIRKVKKTYRLHLFIQIFIDILILGFVFFIISRSEEFTNRLIATFICFPMLLELIIPFQFGQDLKIRSKQVLEAFSYPKWHNINETLEYTRIYFLSRYKKPLKIELSKYVSLSIKTLLVTISLSVFFSLFLMFLENIINFINVKFTLH